MRGPSAVDRTVLDRDMPRSPDSAAKAAAQDAKSGRRIAFVVGCPRSGTTLVQQLLNAHPRVSIGPETHYVRRFWLARDRYGDLRGEAAWSALLRDVSAIPELRDGDVDPAVFLAAASRLPHEHPALLRLLMELFAGDRDVAVIGEKTPNHVLHMRLLQDWFPEALFVHVLRDPRAVVNSWRTVPWSTGSVSGDAAVWRRYMRSAVRN
ncbi:MAG: sulfotransferase family protein, partial [Longimicrobiales bacterium]